MPYHFSRCNRTEPWASAIEKTEHKTPFCGHPNGSEMRFASNGNSQRNAVRLLIASRGSDREGCPQKGVFHFSRTPHDSNAPSWVARKKSSLARNMAHCTALAYLTGGDVPAASWGRKPNKRCYGRKPGGEFGQLKIGIGDYGSVQGQHLNR